MENNTITRKKRKRIWPIEIIAGLFIMMIVFFIAVNVDIKTTQETLSDTAHYINEQCNSFTRLNLASETKSLLRVIESAQQIKHNITYERSLSDKDIFTEEFIKKNMQECYLTAVIIMDSKGNLIDRNIQMNMVQMSLTNILTVLHLLMLLIILKKHTQ